MIVARTAKNNRSKYPESYILIDFGIDDCPPSSFLLKCEMAIILFDLLFFGVTSSTGMGRITSCCLGVVSIPSNMEIPSFNRFGKSLTKEEQPYKSYDGPVMATVRSMTADCFSFVSSSSLLLLFIEFFNNDSNEISGSKTDMIRRNMAVFSLVSSATSSILIWT